ncbi:MAG: DUF3499 family protein [Ilumatobacter sp.]|uniref:DUF3499 family protein n=1 Tax=Ilumatobacter sp. TaxID=1967498 RepID=UPI003C75F736
MGVGPDETNRDDQRDASLFDRIAREIADTASAFPADETADLMRPDTDLSTGRASGADDSGPGGILLERSGVWPAPDISTQIERPLVASRQCSRTGCSDAAAVTLTYDYRQSQVWIDRLAPERNPHDYDMCDRHAERLSVPRGWHLDDRRGARRNSLIAV